MPSHDPRPLLALTLTPGLGPILIRRLLEAFGAPEPVFAAPLASLKAVRGIGEAKALSIHSGLRAAPALAEAELARAAKLNVSILTLTDPTYPPLLAEIPDAPPVLYVKGQILASGENAPDRYPVAIVGSRRCTPYGTEQAERFGGHLSASGLTVVSGGARGIDTAAHRAAIRNRAAGARTIAVLGCGLAHAYPEENAPLFDQIADGNGAVVSELPLDTPPTSENFPARNRIISGLSLGTLVIEAGAGSGALITAKAAAEEHGREVFALPGRVDSPSSEGSLNLLKMGGALLVTEPADVISALESPARHVYGDTHAARFQPIDRSGSGASADGLFTTTGPERGTAPKDAPSLRELKLTPTQQRILESLSDALTMDQLLIATGLDPASLRADVTHLELQRLVTRAGSKLRRS